MKRNYEKRIYIRNICVVVILLAVISTLICPVIGGNNQSMDNKLINKSINYRISIDQYHGFYRIYYMDMSGKVAQVQYNGTLNINKEDTVTWINDAVPDVKLTVISQQKLWGDYAGVLKWAYKQFSYTFNESGMYDIYVKEYPKFKQKIIVGPITNIKKSNLTDVTKSILVSSPSKINSTKINLSQVNLSKTNIINVSRNIPEKNEIRPIIYLSILPISVMILMIYATKIGNKKRQE